MALKVRLRRGKNFRDRKEKPSKSTRGTQTFEGGCDWDLELAKYRAVERMKKTRINFANISQD